MLVYQDGRFTIGAAVVECVPVPVSTGAETVAAKRAKPLQEDGGNLLAVMLIRALPS